MNKIILLLLLLNCLTIKLHSQNFDLHRLSDSLDVILDTYKSYVPDLQERRKDIVIVKLPFQIDSLSDIQIHNNFYTLQEVKDIFKNDIIAQGKVEQAFSIRKAEIESHLGTRFTPTPVLNGYQTPIQKTIKDYQFFFIDPRGCPLVNPNTKDLALLAHTCEMDFSPIINKQLYGVKDDISSLIFSKNYLGGDMNYEVPQLLRATIKNNLKKALLALNKNDYNKVKNITISFQKPDTDRRDLWVSNNNVNKIYISPFLIRAAFFYAVNSSTLFRQITTQYNNDDFANGRYFGKNTTYDITRKNPNEVKEICENISHGMGDAFTFVIAHELAHIYNIDPSLNNRDEIRCDCFAFKTLNEKYPLWSFGIYYTIFQESVNKRLYSYWGATSNSDFVERFKYVDLFLKKSIVNCDNIFSNN